MLCARVNWIFRSLSDRNVSELVLSKHHVWASLMAQLVKNPPAMRETWVRSVGWKDPLEKGKVTHSSILAWRIPWSRKELDTTEQVSLHFKHHIYLRISWKKNSIGIFNSDYYICQFLVLRICSSCYIFLNILIVLIQE